MPAIYAKVSLHGPTAAQDRGRPGAARDGASAAAPADRSAAEGGPGDRVDARPNARRVERRDELPPAHPGQVPVRRGRCGLLEADRALGRQLLTEYSRWIERWYDELPRWDRRWRAAANGTDQWFELTADELRSLADEVLAVLDRYADQKVRDEDTERVAVVFHAFPQRRGEA